ncbi:RodZ domain-containing protein [Dechloromonas sp. ZY10]|uniref:helix-turn-helix domain-containing protein n=1 Tax=Dechloromonas aquae TaxID=2664436 RepID=UPI00352898CC
MSEQTGSVDMVDGTEAGYPAATPVGELLRGGRDAKGLTKADIAQTLKLGVRQVEALERGNWELLPGATFIRGFVRNYARLVQLDSEPLMRELDRCLIQKENRLSLPDAQPTDMPVAGARMAQRDRVVVFSGLALVVIALLIYSLFAADLSALRDQAQQMLDAAKKTEEKAAVVSSPVQEALMPPGASERDVLNPQNAVNDAAVSSSAPVAAVSNPNPPVATVDVPSSGSNPPQIRFSVLKESWIEVRDRDNRVLYSQRLPADSEHVLSGQGPLSLVIGYAPGVKLFWHGQAVDLQPHTKGDVARLVLE